MTRSPSSNFADRVRRVIWVFGLMILMQISPANSPDTYAASWVCGAISAGGGTGWSVNPNRSRAQSLALRKCRARGGGCFLTGCQYGVGQTPAEAARTRPPAPPRVFKNIPEQRVLPPPVRSRRSGLPAAKPALAPPQPVTANKPTARASGSANTKPKANTKPAKLSTNRVATQGECRYPSQRLPTAGKIEVNPCADTAKSLKNVYVPQPRLKHKAPQAPIHLPR